MTRCFWTFPANIDLVLNGIASGRPVLDERISCEPPWCNSVLPSLRRRRDHPATGTNIIESRRPKVQAYVQVLTSWLALGDIEYLKKTLPESGGLAETIYRRLGPPTRLTVLQVERLRIALGV